VESIYAQQARQKETGECLIFFIDKPELRWWDHVFRTRPGFRHCFMVSWSHWAQRWLLIDWRTLNLDAMMLFPFELSELEEFAREQDATIVRYTPKQHDVTSRTPVFIYCTTALQHFLGLSSGPILTPYRLYRKLLKLGGKQIYSGRAENELRC